MLTIERTKPYKQISIWLISLVGGFAISYALLGSLFPGDLPIAKDPIDQTVSVLGVNTINDQYNQETQVPVQNADVSFEEPQTLPSSMQPVTQSSPAAATTQNAVAPSPVETQPVVEQPAPVAPVVPDVPEDPNPLEVVLDAVDSTTGGTVSTLTTIL